MAPLRSLVKEGEGGGRERRRGEDKMLGADTKIYIVRGMGHRVTD